MPREPMPSVEVGQVWRSTDNRVGRSGYYCAYGREITVTKVTKDKVWARKAWDIGAKSREYLRRRFVPSNYFLVQAASDRAWS